MDIQLYNTKTRSKDRFEPLNREHVKMYVCGPTVYDRAHLGNARPVLVFDTLYRLMTHVFPKVTYVRNFTDVDDRINETALKRKEAGAKGTLEELITERSNETISWYHADMDALGALRPDAEPRATGYIAEMIAFIEGLIADGHAYAAEGHALFSVDSYADYGRLSGRSVEDMIAGARVEVAPYKRNPMDFVLWKPSDDDLPGWESPWGRGRPGWHIECSAMSHALLGKSFDIHGGGNDLMFPHHENEIAQSRCAGHDFAQVWMHNEMLQVEGKKMSKSLGNFFTVRDLLDQGVPGEVIRFVMLSTHYRKPMDWTEKKREEAEKTLRKWRSLASGASSNGTIDPAVLAAIADDLNVPKAIAELHRMASDISSMQPDEAAELVDRFAASARFIGLLEDSAAMGGWVFDGAVVDLALEDVLNAHSETLTAARAKAMENKDFAEVDRLKAALISAGVEVRMSKAGVELVPGPDFDAAKLEAVG